MRKTCISSLAALAFAAIAVPAHADTVSIAVSYEDLDLSSDEDMAILVERIEMAAQEACYTSASRYWLSLREADRACYDAIMAGAEAQIAEIREAA